MQPVCVQAFLIRAPDSPAAACKAFLHLGITLLVGAELAWGCWDVESGNGWMQGCRIAKPCLCRAPAALGRGFIPLEAGTMQPRCRLYAFTPLGT